MRSLADLHTKFGSQALAKLCVRLTPVCHPDALNLLQLSSKKAEENPQDTIGESQAHGKQLCRAGQHHFGPTTTKVLRTHLCAALVPKDVRHAADKALLACGIPAAEALPWLCKVVLLGDHSTLALAGQ